MKLKMIADSYLWGILVVGHIGVLLAVEELEEKSEQNICALFNFLFDAFRVS